MACYTIVLCVFLCWYNRSPPCNEPGPPTVPAPKPCNQEHLQQQINKLRNQVGQQIFEALQEEKNSFEKRMDFKIQEDRQLLFNQFNVEIEKLRNSVTDKVSANELSDVKSRVSEIESDLHSTKSLMMEKIEDIKKKNDRIQEENHNKLSDVNSDLSAVKESQRLHVLQMDQEMADIKTKIDKSKDIFQDGINKMEEIKLDVDDLEVKLSGFKQHLFHKSNFCF